MAARPPARLQNLGEAAPLLATPAAAKANAPQLQHLAVWAPLPLLDAIALASGAAGHHPAVLAYVMRSLEVCRPQEVAFFLPQLVQASLEQQLELLPPLACCAGGVLPIWGNPSARHATPASQQVPIIAPPPAS
jgi:hypothetical protein